MMNKLIGVSLLCLSLSFPAQADDRLTLAEIYQTVQDEYLEPVSLNEIAMPALQGLVTVPPSSPSGLPMTTAGFLFM